MQTNKILPTKTVYSLYYPEIQKIISNTTRNYPHEIYLQSIAPGLDDFHQASIFAYENHFHKYLEGLSAYNNKYFCAGASEGIFHILSHLRAFHNNTPLYQLSGEYEGYSAYGHNLGLKFTNVEKGQKFEDLELGYFFISNPSARNGNYLDDKLVNTICEAGHKVILDITYYGAAFPKILNLSHKNIVALVISLSKPFGLYYYRIGFTYSRINLPTLEANKWFKNILSCIIAKNVLETIKPFELYRKYSSLQEEFVDRVNFEFNIQSKASDVFLLAHSKVTKDSLSDQNISPYLRNDYARFCLSPYYLEKFQKSDCFNKEITAHEEYSSLQ